MMNAVFAGPVKGYRSCRSVISYAVWAYHRFSMSLRDVEDLLAERGITVSHETIRAWCGWFGPDIAASSAKSGSWTKSLSRSGQEALALASRGSFFQK